MPRFKLRKIHHHQWLVLELRYRVTPYWKIYDTQLDPKNHAFVVATFIWDENMASVMCAHLNELHGKDVPL